MLSNLPKSAVFITGTFIGNNCWDEWKLYFESKGYKCLAPAWPHKDASPEELRNRNPYDEIASNRIAGLTDYFADIINILPEKPILIGHSLGGLIVQLLLQRKLGSAGIAIHSFPPADVNTIKFSFIKTMWEAMALLTPSQKTYMMLFGKWKQSIANNLAYDQQKELYYKYATPESKGVIRDAFKCNTKINFLDPHPPLLFTSGSRDHIIPSSLNFINYKKYINMDSITGYVNFKDHGHLVFDFPHWREEAQYVLNWLDGLRQLVKQN